jgi:hypothetical protein
MSFCLFVCVRLFVQSNSREREARWDNRKKTKQNGKKKVRNERKKRKEEKQGNKKGDEIKLKTENKTIRYL